VRQILLRQATGGSTGKAGTNKKEPAKAKKGAKGKKSSGDDTLSLLIFRGEVDSP
jgi:hypothetical protein